MKNNINNDSLEITSSGREKNYHQRARLGQCADGVKKAALKDITEECGAGMLYKRNYVHSEAMVLMSCEYIQDRIPINTNIY